MNKVNISQNGEMAKNYRQFRLAIIEQNQKYIKEFIEKTSKELGDGIASLYWQKDLTRLQKKHARMLKHKYYSICFVARWHHRNKSKNKEDFDLTKPYELLKKCHDIFLLKFDQLLKKKKINENLVNYTKTASEFVDEVKKIQDNTLGYFQTLFDQIFFSKLLTSKMNKKTEKINIEIVLFVKLYCSSICKKASKYIVGKKKGSQDACYSVLKARNDIQRWIKKLERTFWNNEMQKVDFMNKPHRRKTKLLEKPTNCALYLKDVSKYYTNGVCTSKALSEINLEILPGEFVIIFGESGSGKTTLLNILSGIDRASDGYVYCDQKDLTTLSNAELTRFRKKNIGYVFQQCCLLPNLTVQENIEIGADLQTEYEKKIDITLLLKDIGMLEKKDNLPIELSGGQQQRVAIARAIAKNPLILFADEPTAALDEATANNIMQLFLSLRKKYQTTIIVVSHNESFCRLADKVIRIENGKMKSIEINQPSSEN